MTIQYIDTPDALVQLCKDMATTEWLALDTEFLREKTYYPQLCLIQVATADIIACVDPIALNHIDPLLDLIYRPDITVIFHAARQDLELLYLLRKTLPDPIFDTQLAATVLGYGDQIGYGNLVKQCLNVDLDKAHSRTDWTKRPLDRAQIEYAADDVRYLRDIYHQLKQELSDKKRGHWLTDDFANLTNPATYEPEPEDIWRKIKGNNRLKGVQLAVLQRLSAWREKQAIKANRPRRWILKDEVLIDLSRLGPENMEQLAQIRGLESNNIKRHSHDWYAEIKAAKALSKENWPKMKRSQPLTKEQDAVIDALMALLRKLCSEQSIAPAAITTRKELERLVDGQTNIPLLQGWRNEIIGQHLQSFLDGKLTINADYQQLYTEQKG